MKKARARNASRKELLQTIRELERKAGLDRQINEAQCLALEGKDQEIAQQNTNLFQKTEAIKTLVGKLDILEKGLLPIAEMHVLVAPSPLPFYFQ